MPEITIVNLKCGGCAKSIQKALSQAGFSQVLVSQETNRVSFEGNREVAKSILEKLGYPEAGSEKAKSLIRRAKSFLSCARGKMEK
ncbi:MAG: heavy-metal-associated domain-containing protein [Patescibacteria group bacterium]